MQVSLRGFEDDCQRAAPYRPFASSRGVRHHPPLRYTREQSYELARTGPHPRVLRLDAQRLAALVQRLASQRLELIGRS